MIETLNALAFGISFVAMFCGLFYLSFTLFGLVLKSLDDLFRYK